MRATIITLLVLTTAAAAAKSVALKATLFGNPAAPTGGTLYRVLAAEPESFNPLNSNSVYAVTVAGLAVESLLSTNLETYDFEPGLATSYDVSSDFLTYTFHIDPAAHFSDGTPVTAEDVRFSLTYMKDPAYKAAARASAYESIDRVETPDPRTAVVRLKRKYYQNLEVIGGAPIYPKHIYQDPHAKFPNSAIFGSGAYKVDKYTRGQTLVMTRDPNYWGRDVPGWKGANKFDRVSFRFVEDEGLRFEKMKRGDFDHMDDVRAESFVTRAVGPVFETKVKKIKFEDSTGKAWGFIAWNFKDPEHLDRPHPILANKDVRNALAMLLNRKLIIEKFMYGLETEGRGPALTRSQMLSPTLKPIEFNPRQAGLLLKKAGWTDSDKDGVLDKTIDGRKVDFHVTLLYANRDNEKFFTIYKEDLRQAGIVLDIKLIEWGTFTKVIGEHKFDAISMRWGGGGRESDLKQIWHTDSAKDNGSNFNSYSNPVVDKLIDQAREEMDTKKRLSLWQKASTLIAEDGGYTYLFNPKYTLFMLNSRIGYDKVAYEYGSGLPFYWIAK